MASVELDYFKDRLRKSASSASALVSRLKAIDIERAGIIKALDSFESAASTMARPPAQTNGGEPPTKNKRAARDSKRSIIIDLLMREGGCTGAEVKSATGWKTVPLQNYAKSAGLTLRKERQGKTVRYWAK